MQTTNQPGSDIVKVLKGAAIAASGALLTYLGEWATSTDFGQWTPAVAAVAAVAVNAARKLMNRLTAEG